ncbi:MAG: efflux RND transporter permease subunit, partial [Rhodothermia bacterium]
MRITDLAVKYKTTTVVLTVVLTVGGLLSYLTIPKEANPSIEVPIIVVTTVYPGVSPADIESLITQRIEQEVQSVNGIKEIRSTSTEGVSTVVIEFDPDVSIDEAYQKVRDKVDIAKPDLPSDVEEPRVQEIDFSEFPILTLNLASNYSLARLKDVAQDLADEIETIPSILEVDLIGGLEREVQVNVDLNALKGYNVSFNDVIQAIARENTTIPGGSIDVDRLNYLVRVSGEFTDTNELYDLVVKVKDPLPGLPVAPPIYVRDVAEIVYGFKDRSTYARLTVLKDENAEGDLIIYPDDRVQELQVISLNVKKRSGENILETVTAVQGVLDEFALPQGTEVVITGDQSKFVRTLVADLENNIISGLLFVVVVLLWFLGVRNATLVGIAIPLSMFTSFIVFQALGYTLNFIILFSLIIALGMLVDNAIVIVENIFRFREEGHSRFDAARLATKEVAGAVVASTATTVAAFAPMMFWPGIIGEFMAYMPLTLIVTLVSSLFVALVINPVITGIFVRLDTEQGKPHGTWAKRFGFGSVAVAALIVGLANPITLAVGSAAIVFFWLSHKYFMKPMGDQFMKSGLPKLIVRYRNLLNWMLQRDYRAPRAYLRNTWSLVSFTVGTVFLIAGAVIGAGLGENAGAVLLWPGMIFAAVGVAGILFHCIEIIFQGGWTSIKAGIGLALVVAAVLSLIRLSGKPIGPEVIQSMGSIPVLIVLIGLFGLAHLKFTWLKAVDRAFLGLAALMFVFGIGLAVTLFGLPQAGVQLIDSENTTSMTGAMGGLIQGGLLLGILGILGRLSLKGRGYLLLTDNRSKLMNASMGALFAIIGLFVVAPTGVEFFPETDPQQIRVNITGALGTNIEASNNLAIEARRRTQELLDDEVSVSANTKNVLVNVGVGGDTRFGGGSSGIENSSITMNMVDYADRMEPSSETLARIREQISGLPGAEIEIDKDQQGPPTGSPVNIEISGEQFETIVRISRDVKELLIDGLETGAIPGLVDVRDNLDTGRPELKVNINRERAARFGLSTRAIASTIRTAINGTEASKFRDGEDEYDITVRLKEADRNNLESLQNLTIFDEGQQIPLVAVADFEVVGGLGSITRLDLKRVVTVRGENAPGFSGPQVLASAQQYLLEYKAALPPGYRMTYTGASEEQDESFGFLTKALLIGISLIFMIMVAQFNRVSVPFIIMVAVGFSIVGVMLGLILTRTMFGLMTFIGIISLAGIVVNNNIVLVDYIMQLRERGYSKHDAIVQGGATRMRPVLLTALTTVLGLMPLTFGINIDFVGLLTEFKPAFQFGSENTQFWGPMGTSIISGLVFATFLTLVLVPVMYSLFDSVTTKLGSQFASGDLAVETESSVEADADGATPVVLPTGNGFGTEEP